MREPHSNNSFGREAERARARSRGREGGTGVAVGEMRVEERGKRNVRGCFVCACVCVCVR